MNRTIEQLKFNRERDNENFKENKGRITLSDLKSVIKRNPNYFNYYKNILLGNEHRWNFTDPRRGTKSHCNKYNYMQFLVFKKLLKQGYRVRVYVDRHEYYNIYLFDLYKKDEENDNNK